jgi:hypothetical protein
LDGGVGIKGSWSELTPSCPETLSAFVVFVGGGGDTVMGTGSSGMGGVDIGVGASGSEQVINHNLLVNSENTENIRLGGAAKVYGCMIPKGARVTARWSQNVSTTSVDVSLVGIPWRP